MQTMTLEEAKAWCHRAKITFDGEEEKRRTRGGTTDRAWIEARKDFDLAMDAVAVAKGEKIPER